MEQFTVAGLIAELQKYSGDLPVFAMVESSTDWPIIRVVGYDNGVTVEFEREATDMLKLIVNVNEKFEPGAESLGYFVAEAAVELMRVARECDKAEFDGDLHGAVKAAKCSIVEVEDEY